jgi:BirA family biotin operon repressor/biotin-[acetyl-CoA-carboxylase] ligase
MASPFTDLDRPPLSPRGLSRALVTPGSLWSRIDVRAETGSTNADASAGARLGEPEGLVVLAESQWLPLLAGVALLEAVQRVAEVEAALKWPNDLLVGDAKCAGILAEIAGEAVVVGIGLNVTTRVGELPETTGLPATSLKVAGATNTDRDPLLRALLRGFAGWYAGWREADGDAELCGLLPAYRRGCATIGRHVRVLRPGGDALTGEATSVDAGGQLVVRTADGGDHRVSAGDVLHVR